MRCRGQPLDRRVRASRVPRGRWAALPVVNCVAGEGLVCRLHLLALNTRGRCRVLVDLDGTDGAPFARVRGYGHIAG